MTDTEQKYYQLLHRVEKLGSVHSQNVVAFSGGVDSSLVVHAVHAVFPANSKACLGISSSLSEEQHRIARTVAHHIGIQLIEQRTDEGLNTDYIANTGTSCYYCKTELYAKLRKIHASISEQFSDERIVIFNGTNADDVHDPTRLGLKAADEFNIASPLITFTKQAVRELARFAGLPNWNYAAAPCLRSRLQFGVQATADNLRRVEEAEAFVRSLAELTPAQNLRVRHLDQDVARIDADEEAFLKIALHYSEIDNYLRELGYSSVTHQQFESGSLSGSHENIFRNDKKIKNTL